VPELSDEGLGPAWWVSGCRDAAVRGCGVPGRRGAGSAGVSGCGGAGTPRCRDAGVPACGGAGVSGCGGAGCRGHGAGVGGPVRSVRPPSRPRGSYVYPPGQSPGKRGADEPGAARGPARAAPPRSPQGIADLPVCRYRRVRTTRRRTALTVRFGHGPDLCEQSGRGATSVASAEVVYAARVPWLQNSADSEYGTAALGRFACKAVREAYDLRAVLS
jgi:hypothetical protein